MKPFRDILLVSAFGTTSQAYHVFVTQGCPYTTVNLPGGIDETLGTFMTVGNKCVEHPKPARSSGGRSSG